MPRCATALPDLNAWGNGHAGLEGPVADDRGHRDRSIRHRLSPDRLADDGNTAGISERAGRSTITPLEPIGSVDTPEATTTTGTRTVLDIAVAILVRDQWLGMIIESHCDSIGSRELSELLSEARAAEAIACPEAAGIDPSRLSSVGDGKDRPIASNETAAGKASNRRVAFIFEQRVMRVADQNLHVQPWKGAR